MGLFNLVSEWVNKLFKGSKIKLLRKNKHGLHPLNGTLNYQHPKEVSLVDYDFINFIICIFLLKLY